MEQAIWLAFGVIAVGIGFAIIGNLISSNREDTALLSFRESIDKLGAQCDFVCDTAVDTYLSVDVIIPSGTRLYTHEDRICGNLNISRKIDDENKCAICSCAINGSLDLQTKGAREAFDQRKYSCYFERRENDIQMECKG